MNYATTRRTRNGDIDRSGKLFDTIMKQFNLKNDAALSRFLDIEPPRISKIRIGYSRISSEMILEIYDATGFSLENIYALLGEENRPRTARRQRANARQTVPQPADAPSQVQDAAPDVEAPAQEQAVETEPA